MQKIYNEEPYNLIKHYEIQRQLEIHDKKIQNSRATLNFRSANNLSKFNETTRHIKKQPLAEFNRIVSINIENKALLKKLTNQPASKIGKQKPYKLIKNNRTKLFESYKQRLENEGLSKRIRETKSSYKMDKYLTDRKKTEKYVNSICKFQYKDYKPNKTLIINKHQPKPTEPLQFPPNPQQISRIHKQGQHHQRNTDQVYFIKRLIDKKQLCLGGQQGSVSGVIWSHKISLEVVCSNQSTFSLEIPMRKFIAEFDENEEELIKNIKYSQKSQQLYIQCPKR